MFDIVKYEDRLAIWSKFRDSLETELDPFLSVMERFSSMHHQSLVLDPWNQTTWKTPWELIYDNQYCAFSLCLMMYYTLGLTDKFKDFQYNIFICRDTTVNFYVLSVDDKYLSTKFPKPLQKNNFEIYNILHTYNNLLLHKN